MSVATPLPNDQWTNLGPTPMVLTLTGDQPVAYMVAAAAPGDALVASQTLTPDQALLIRGAGSVYARPALPIRSERAASVTVQSFAEFMTVPPPADLNKLAERSAVLSMLAGSPQAYLLLSGSVAPEISGIAGGAYLWRVAGTFGGAIATLQFLDLDGNWISLRNKANTDNVALAAVGQKIVSIGQGARVRVSLSGGGQATALKSALSGLVLGGEPDAFVPGALPDVVPVVAGLATFDFTNSANAQHAAGF